MSGTLKVKRLDPRATLPVYGSAGAGAFDVHALQPGRRTLLQPGDVYIFETGLAFEVPPGHLMMLNVRSGMGAKHGLRLRNTIGYIDSDYRGELLVILENRGEDDYFVNHGDRIAQAAIVPAPQYEIVEVDELSSTERGEGGFGSTGK